MATALGCDPLELWRQAGFLAASPAALPQVEREQVAAELAKYRLYAETAEGHEMIVQHFLPKLQQLQAAGQLIDQLRAMYDLYMDPATAPVRCHVLGSVLLYFVLATDLIPDYLFPVGYLDDALAIELTWPQVQPWLAERAAQPTDDPAPGE